MTIVTGSSSIKDSFMSNTIKRSNFVFGGLVILNVLTMLLSAIIYGNIVKDTMTLNVETNITIQQFIVSLICYIFTVIIGIGIQIGGGLDE
ncbi:MAG: hypothetical protein NC548_64400 [Lachnospiraceae bacterium]|nr:hypothetical protein [Lachnospiraceae bacterium]